MKKITLKPFQINIIKRLENFSFRKFVDLDNFFNVKNIVLLFVFIWLIVAFLFMHKIEMELLSPLIRILSIIGWGTIGYFVICHTAGYGLYKKIIPWGERGAVIKIIGVCVGLSIGWVFTFFVRWMHALLLSEVLVISIATVFAMLFSYLVFRFFRYSNQNIKGGVAYIDGNNLHKGSRQLGWVLDYQRFRQWLKDKYDIERAVIFIGYLKKNEKLYSDLRSQGYELCFKEVSYGRRGEIKGNVDSDLVQKVMEDYSEEKLGENSVVIVSGDGDYAPNIRFLKKKGLFRALLAPCNESQMNNGKRSGVSVLLKKLNIRIDYIGNHKNVLEKKKRRPAKTIHRKAPIHRDNKIVSNNEKNVNIS